MKRIQKCAGMLALTLLPVLSFAGTINDEEEHVLRGFFDRQSAAATYNQLAITKASTPDLQAFARSEIEMYKTLAADVTGLYRQFELNRQPPSAENKSPTLGQGITRGLNPLPEGYTWAADSVGSFISTGEALPGMPAAGRYSELDALKGLSGAEFDKQYLLRVLLSHNAMMKHIITQLSIEDGNPDMVAFAEKALIIVQNQSNLAQRLYENNGTLPQRGPRPAEAK